jgi:hypothetical protein
MYTPSYIKRQNQYTKGGEYMIGGEEYIGYYNITVRGPYTGRVYADKEQPLFVLKTVFNEQSQIYTGLAEGVGYTTDLDFDDPTPAVIAPNKGDIKRGFFNRYFIQKRNDKRARVYELDKDQYSTVSDGTAGINPSLFKSVVLRWKIVGPEFDVKSGSLIITPGVSNTNARTLIEKSKVIKGLYTLLKNRLTKFSPYDINNSDSNTDIEL